MKSLLSIFVLLIALSGCSPTTLFYQTPPVYFASTQNIPTTDSAAQMAVSAKVMMPANIELSTEYRIYKSLLLNFSYCGNFWGYSDYSVKDFDYRYHTNSFDLGAGIIHAFKKSKLSWFVLADYGWGHTTSIVREYDNSVEFIYKGNFSKFCFTPGIQFAEKNYRLSLSNGQSFIRFSKYQLPDTIYYNKRQFLSDLMMDFTIHHKRMGFNLFLKCFLNGETGGNRLEDNKPDIWRIERWYLGGGFSYKFSLAK